MPLRLGQHPPCSLPSEGKYCPGLYSKPFLGAWGAMVQRALVACGQKLEDDL